MNKRIGFWVCIFAICFSREICASELEVPIEEVVSTASRSEKPLSAQSGSISVISKDDLAFIKSSHFNEMAVRVPGVNIARNNGQEYLASIHSPIFTGAGACGAFLMAQDGIALRAAGFCNANELFEAFTEQAARIEITKGPGSALYGSNAMHGIVNIITPKANSNEGHLSIEGGANDFIRFNLSKGIIGDKNGLRAMATLTHDGGYRDQSGYDLQKISLRHEYRGEDWTVENDLMVTNLDQKTAGYITGLDAYKDPQIAKSNPSPEAYRKAKSLRYWSRLSSEISDGIRLQVTPYLRVLDMEFLMHFLPGQPVEENSQTSFGVQNGVYFNEGGPFEVIIGADFEYARGSLKQTQEKATEGSLFLRKTIPSGKQYDYDVGSFMAAAFGQGDLSLNNNLHLLAGVRLEYLHYDYTNNMLAGRTAEDGTPCDFGGCRYSRPASRKDDFLAISPKFGFLYNISENHDFYVNVSHGFRAPQAAELYRLERAQTVADLKNVNLKTVEFGLKGKQDRLSYLISFYAMKKDNYIFRDSAYFNVDNGKSDHMGADIMVKFTVSERLSLQGNLSLARHRYKFDYISNGINLNGKDMDSAPRHFGSMQMKWRPTDKITAEAEWVHMGPYYLDSENIHRYGGHDYFNFRADVKVEENYRLFLHVMNVTNIKYAERADYTSFTDERYFPGKPRSVFAGIGVIF